jgi:hypothetical protein
MCERARGGTNTSGLVWMPAGPAGRGTSAGRDGTRSDPVGATCDPGSSPRRHAGARGAGGAWGARGKARAVACGPAGHVARRRCRWCGRTGSSAVVLALAASSAAGRGRPAGCCDDVRGRWARTDEKEDASANFESGVPHSWVAARIGSRGARPRLGARSSLEPWRGAACCFPAGERHGETGRRASNTTDRPCAFCCCLLLQLPTAPCVCHQGAGAARRMYHLRVGGRPSWPPILAVAVQAPTPRPTGDSPSRNVTVGSNPRISIVPRTPGAGAEVL